MDWTVVITAAFGAAVGALIALAGVGISELGQSRRAKNAAEATAAARLEDRRTELWEISLPAAASAQASLARIIRLSRKPNPKDSSAREVPFDEGFERAWEEDELDFNGHIALIPSADFRELLGTVSEGIGFGWALGNKSGYAVGYRAAVNKIARVGFDLVSAWMRDERTVGEELRGRVRDITASVQDAHAQYQIEYEETTNPEGY